ncbi:MAG: alpha-2-macroglobulin family protein [Vicinamibacterales bacterium]
MRSRTLLLLVALWLACCPADTRAQAPAALTIVQSGPTGEIASLQEANEIRIVFSEPMVALGRIPDPVTAPFVTIRPAVAGAFRWSGTTILIFTPDPSRKLPYATRYDVTVDTSAAAVSGRRLAAPYTFTFTTPTVRLIGLDWYRKNKRFDDPMVLALRFNQPVRGADLLAHVRLRFEAHPFDPPVLTPEGRARLRTVDPQAVPRFQAKVAAATAAASARAPVGYAPASAWDTEQFPASPDLVVIETIDRVPPDSWVRVEIDTTAPAMGGAAVPGITQSRRVEAEETFFVNGPRCRVECAPDDWNAVALRGRIDLDALRAHLSVRNVSAPSQPIVSPAKEPDAQTWEFDDLSSFSLEDAGYDRQPPDSRYVVRLDPGLTATDGQTLGYTWIDIVENWHERAFTSFGDGHGVWESDGGPALPFYSRNFKDVTQWASRLSRDQLMPTILRLQPAFSGLPQGQGQHRTLRVTPDKIESHGLDLSGLLGSGATGLVWAGVTEGEPIDRSARLVSGRERSTIVQVTNLGISVKDSPLNTLVFVTRLDTGQPVPGARVTLIDRENRAVWTAITGNDGVALAPGSPRAHFWQFEFLVVAEKDGDLAYLGSDWHEGIAPWDFGYPLNLREAQPILRGSVFTDRGVYRLGEEAHLKAILRLDTPSGIRMLEAGTPIDVITRDSQGRDVDKRTITIGEWSSSEWTLTLPADGALGTYQIAARRREDARPGGARDGAAEDAPAPDVTGTFLVAAYRRPDFRVDATLTSGEPIAGATLNGTVSARYLFGSSMAGRKIAWRTTRERLCSEPPSIREHFSDTRFVFAGDCDDRSGVEDVGSAEAVLDSRGELTTSVATPASLGRPYRYTIEGDVEDLSRQHIAGRASVVIHPAPWYIGVLAASRFVDQRTGFRTSIVAVANDGTVVPGVDVHVTLRQIQWNSVRRAEGQGFYTWETTRKEIEVGTWAVTSSTEPVPLSIPLPAGGAFEVVAVARDDAGRSTTTTTSFYALGTGYTAWERFDHNRIDLVPDRITYKPGDSARILIQSPWERATALLTTEREGVRTRRQFDLTSTQQYVTVPIADTDIPNVFVSVLLVKGRTVDGAPDDGSDPGKPAFRLGYVELKVEDASKRLSLAVTANRAEYRPANAAHIDVDVKDASGKPVASEVTLWAVDYGVLSLTGFRTPDVLRSVYVEKSLQVTNVDSRQRLVSRRAIVPKGEDAGGGGGSENGVDALRKDFRPLAFWVGSITSGADGRASADVTLPESLTTYRIMAVAADRVSRFGSAESEIRVNKPLTLKPTYPRFLAVGDTAVFGSVVASQLADGGETIVTIRSLDPTLIEIRGASRRSIQLGPGGVAEVRFEAVAKGVGPARVQMTARLRNETDAFQDVIPVEILAPPETVAAYGEASPAATETVSLPAGVLAGFGGLRVELSSTAMVGLGEGARYLVEYPYGCAEQQASRAFAMLLASDLGEAFPLPGIDPKDLRRISQAAIQNLRTFQCPNGGFSSWPGACFSTSPYLTSYILNVFARAGSLQYEVSDEVVQSASAYLERELSQPPPQDDGWWPAYTAWQAFAVKVLAEGGRNQDSNINRLYERLDRMPVFGLSYLLDALVAKGEEGRRVEELQRRIGNAVLPDAGGAHVEELDDPYLLWFWNSNVRSTAIALRGLMRDPSREPLVRPAVRWLLNARKNGRWGNTQENALAMDALVAYYKKYESAPPDFRASVKLAGEEIARHTFQGRSTDAVVREVPMASLTARVKTGAARDLAFTREGAGTLFYAARLSYAEDRLYTDGLDSGFRIQRRYAPYVEKGDDPSPALSYKAGDLVRVTLTLDLPKERRFVAVTDPLPAGFEPVESWFATTAATLATDQRGTEAQGSWWNLWQRGGFDHIERHDDQVRLFATRLAEGHHEFSYVVRATTAGTFRTAPARAEEMYAPDVFGRTATAVVEVAR